MSCLDYQVQIMDDVMSGLHGIDLVTWAGKHTSKILMVAAKLITIIYNQVGPSGNKAHHRFFFKAKNKIL